MIDDDLIKMSIAQTVADTVELLIYLRTETSSTHHQRIDEMVARLLTMANAIIES